MIAPTDRILESHLEDFDHTVLETSHRHPVLVDFWAEWCAPCLVISPALERVVQQFDGDLTLAKVEVDAGENMKLAGRYSVRGFPTVVLFRDGVEQGRFSGARTAEQIGLFLDQALAGA